MFHVTRMALFLSVYVWYVERTAAITDVKASNHSF